MRANQENFRLGLSSEKTLLETLKGSREDFDLGKRLVASGLTSKRLKEIKETVRKYGEEES